VTITVNGMTIPAADRYEFVLDASDGDGRIGPVSVRIDRGTANIECITVNGSEPYPYLTIGKESPVYAVPFLPVTYIESEV
jgi:hypothetical protein